MQCPQWCLDHWRFPVIRVGKPWGALQQAAVLHLGKPFANQEGVTQPSCPASSFCFASLGTWCKPMGLWVGDSRLTWGWGYLLVISAWICMCYHRFIKRSLYFSLFLSGVFFLLAFNQRWTQPWVYLSLIRDYNYLELCTWDLWILSTLMIFKYYNFVAYPACYIP